MRSNKERATDFREVGGVTKSSEGKMTDKTVRVWCIGPDGTELYAAHSEEELKAYYTKLVGKEQAEADIAESFSELSQSDLDTEIDWVDSCGNKIRTTYRKEAEASLLPTQIATGYN